MISEINILLCPICRQNLNLNNRQLSCTNKHSFDLSAKGYVNLLVVNQKKSKDPGDNKEMIDSRRNFLNKGYYQPFSDAINSAAAQYEFGGNAVVLDAGCGEGYYLERLKFFLQNQFPATQFSFYGIDISKPAINLGSNRDKELNLVVGSSYNLPFADESIDCIIQVFAPGSMSEYRRVLKKGGVLITAEPGLEHLFELKEQLYKSAIKNEEREVVSAELKSAAVTEAAYQIEINNVEDNKNLIAMTPYFWHVDKSLQDKIDKISFLKTSLHFVIRTFRKELSSPVCVETDIE